MNHVIKDNLLMINLSNDERNLEKFGDDHRSYIQKVPRINLLMGILKLLRQKEVGEGA